MLPSASFRSTTSESGPPVEASRLASRSSRWVTENSTRIGWSLTTVASTPESGLTRLPGEAEARPMRPAIGDLISV